MCGLAGILTSDPERWRAAAERMSAALAHRGPDDVGFEVVGSRWGDHAALLAHRRLSILDLSAAGKQPMADPRTGSWIVFNGEIYNFQELRGELERAGQRFDSHCDTEVILKGYAVWGRDVLRRLRGMFALAIVDVERREILLARDRIGIKPLYLTRRPQDGIALAFASEVRALLASGVAPRRLSPQGVADYLVNGYTPDPVTIVDGVESLMPGTYLVVKPDGAVAASGAFWEQPPGAAAGDTTDAPARLRAVLDETIRQHMISDVPLGAFLSGGVDSSALTALMTQAAPGQVETFSLVFDDPELSEERYSRAVASKLKTRHHESRVTADEFLSLMNDGLAALDQPTTDAVNSYVVSRKCKESGLTVALAGTGGDELFGGYTSFQRVPKSLRLLRAMQRLPRALRRPLAAAVKYALVGGDGHLPSAGLKGKAAALLDLPVDVLRVYHLSRMVLLPDTVRRLSATAVDDVDRFPPTLESVLRRAVERCDDVREQISILEQSCYMSNQLLRDSDAVSMAVALEVRVPLLDHVLIETAAAMAPNVRFGGEIAKQVLVDAVRDILPSEAYERRKMGFVLPLGRWLSGPLRDSVKDVLFDDALMRSIGLRPDESRRVAEDCLSAGRKIYFTRIWGLFVLADWCRRHGMSMEA